MEYNQFVTRVLILDFALIHNKLMYIYIYIYIRVCVCVCVCVILDRI